MDEVIFAYHGTSKDNAKSIMDDKKFIPGEDIDNSDYLGKGIYFFENYYNAIFWNVRNFKYKYSEVPTYEKYINGYDIIEVLINCARNNILDLNNPCDLVKFDKIVNKISAILDKNNDYKNAKNINGAIINFLYKKNMMEDIFIIKTVSGQGMNTNEHHKANKIQREIICVKNAKVIEELSIYKSIDEDEFNAILYLTFPPKNYNV